MYTCAAAYAAWWQQKFALAIFFTALGSLLGRLYFPSSAVDNKNKLSRMAVCSFVGSTHRLRYAVQATLVYRLRRLVRNISFSHSRTNGNNRFHDIRTLHRSSLQHSQI